MDNLINLHFTITDVYLKYRKEKFSELEVKQEYRDFLRRSKQYIKLSQICKDLNISTKNLYNFIYSSRYDSYMSVESLELIRKEIFSVYSKIA